MSLILIFLFLLPFLSANYTYCPLPKEAHVMNRTWEKYGPNGEICGELRGWAMSHGCFSSGNTFCAPTAPCSPGKCHCIYACDPGYCMTQFNVSPAADSIADKSHGVLCNANGTISKVHSPNSPLCVPCASVAPYSNSPLVTGNYSEISPATIVSNMQSEIAACGLMDPGIDDNVQYGKVSRNLDPLFVSMFPQWWYLLGVQSQVYIGLQNVTPEYFCVGKTNPDLPEPKGNAGFFSVVYTTGGGIVKRQSDGHYLAMGQVAFFGDYGNNNHQNLAKCWFHLGEKCVADYGMRGFVCGKGQVIHPPVGAPPSMACKLHCDIMWDIQNAGGDGSKAQLCPKILKCNLNSCPDPKKCLGSGDPFGCSPVADITLGERIVYELYSLKSKI